MGGVETTHGLTVTGEVWIDEFFSFFFLCSFLIYFVFVLVPGGPKVNSLWMGRGMGMCLDF